MLKVASATLYFFLALAGPTLAGDPVALENVTVIDGLGSAPRQNQTVVLAGSRILSVGSTETVTLPARTERISLPGRYLLPGLIDMHAHFTILPMDEDGVISHEPHLGESENVLRVLLAHGITTLRNPAAPAREAVAMRERVRNGDLLGPRILTAGNPLNRTRATFGPFIATATVGSVRREVNRQAGLGVDFIKVYASLSPDLIQAAIEEAHGAGLEVIGHLQRTSWTEAARLGIDAITHGSPWSKEYLPIEMQSSYRGSFRDRMTWLEEVDFDSEAMQTMIRELVERQIAVDPTLIAYRTKFVADDPIYEGRADLPEVPPTAARIWRRTHFTVDWTSEDYERGRRVWPRVLELTRRMHEAGVLLTAGSDFPNPMVVPGKSLHEELALLVDAGIPELEVLRIATHQAAQALGLETEIGSIEPGKRCDLIVLSANPLEDINNVARIERVFLGGRELDLESLVLPWPDPLDPNP